MYIFTVGVGVCVMSLTSDLACFVGGEHCLVSFLVVGGKVPTTCFLQFKFETVRLTFNCFFYLYLPLYIYQPFIIFTTTKYLSLHTFFSKQFSRSKCLPTTQERTQTFPTLPTQISVTICHYLIAHNLIN